MIAETVYCLCGVMSLACAGFLLRSYRRNKTALLLWSSLFFVAFAINNILLIVDLVVLPEVDLSLIRIATALVGFLLLIFGFIWEKV